MPEKNLRRLIAELRLISKHAPKSVLFKYLLNLGGGSMELMRTKSLVVVDRRMGPRIVPFRVDGCEILLPAYMIGGVRELYGRRVYFADPHVQLRQATKVVDLGGNAGLFSLLAAKKGCKVLTVEAQPGFAAEIASNARRNGVDKSIHVECGLVGAGSGVLSDSRRRANASHMLGETPKELDLALLLDSHGFEEVDFMKVDIEGSEFALFSSGKDWLRRVRVIAMEVHTRQGNLDDIVAVLHEAGFEWRITDSSLNDAVTTPDPDGFL